MLLTFPLYNLSDPKLVLQFGIDAEDDAFEIGKLIRVGDYCGTVGLFEQPKRHLSV